jgi:hypothetical protein
MINPKWPLINIYSDTVFNLRFETSIATWVREIIVTIDDSVIQSANTGDLFVFPVSATGLSVGKHIVKVKVTDANIQTTSKSFILNILPR